MDQDQGGGIRARPGGRPSNPKILYAPAGSEADRVILKVCAAGGLCPLGQELRKLGRGLCRLGTQCGGAAVGRIGTRGVQPWLLRTPGLGSLGEGTWEQVLGAGAL